MRGKESATVDRKGANKLLTPVQTRAGGMLNDSTER